MKLSPLNQRRWRNFRRNRRAFWSMVIFAGLFVLSMLAEVIANDKPIVASYRGELYFPAYRFYPETAFGGDFGTEANYTDPSVECLIISGGREECWDTPEDTISEARSAGTVNGEEIQRGWTLWPPIPYHYRTINNVGTAPSAPDAAHWLGTDDTAPEVFDTLVEFAKEIGMVPIPVRKEKAGYVLNSLLVPLLNAAAELAAGGYADPHDVDKVWCTATGAPLAAR